jgi:2-succinyl-5-enolpyruvyl-6-hydroxy-3-cyclohexene-1-carboxylate synthase
MKNVPFKDDLKVEKHDKLQAFLGQVRAPLVVANALNKADRSAVADFLVRLQAPIYLEGVSGLCHDSRLNPLRCVEPKLSAHDAVLRIGGIPTHRLWRDLESMQDTIKVLSISEHPFAGLSFAPVIHTRIAPFLESFEGSMPAWEIPSGYIPYQQQLKDALDQLFEKEPLAEPSLIRSLSDSFPHSAQVFLGNSMPIREWDLASKGNPLFNVLAVRGLNGIDGQLSCFFGLCEDNRLNIALMGDLTALYDFAGC